MNEHVLLICTDKLTTSNNFSSLCGSRLFKYVHVITHYGLNKVSACFTSIPRPLSAVVVSESPQGSFSLKISDPNSIKA